MRSPELEKLCTDLVTDSLPIEPDVLNMDQLDDVGYIEARRQGLGTSDSSVVLNVNPYKKREDLIKEKLGKVPLSEELEVGKKSAVRKGRDLEPLIIDRFELNFDASTGKPTTQYRHKEYPWMKFNFDGVTGTPEQYIPVEIKVITTFGEKHYNPSKAFYDEVLGFAGIPEDASTHNWAILTKAAHYGIPPYYYTQLQQQILGLNAPHGFLTVLYEKEWRMKTFFIHRDNILINDLIVEGFKLWNTIEEMRGLG